MYEDKEKIIIEFNSKNVVLNFEDFDDEIDVDELTKINPHNIYGEIVTVSALMNRVGIWEATLEEKLAESKLQLDIFKAKREEVYRNTLRITTTDSKGNEKIKYPTEKQLISAVILDEGVQRKVRKVNRLKKEVAFITSLYWAVKSKDSKLNNMSENFNLTPEEFENSLVEGKINGIMIKIKNKNF